MGTCEMFMQDWYDTYQKRVDIKEKLEGRLFLDGQPASVYGLKLDYPVVLKDGDDFNNGVHFTWAILERAASVGKIVNLKS